MEGAIAKPRKKKEVTERTIADLLPDLPRLKVNDELFNTFEEANPFENRFDIVDKNTYIGVEVEVENVQRFERVVAPYWTMIEDGSLRNHGKEFITPPIRAWRIEHAFNCLFNKALNGDVDFSPRTSIHVHMNIRTLTKEQLKALVITYMVFEKVLFSFVGQDRYNSIFCVPLCEASVIRDLQYWLDHDQPLIDWKKYTALNLAPIGDKGTIEFRHHYGTKDIKQLTTWINVILSLKKFALRTSPEEIWTTIKELNTTSQYRLFGEQVFGALFGTIITAKYNEEIERCVTVVKEACLPNEFNVQIYKSVTKNSKLYLFKCNKPKSLRDYLVEEELPFLDEREAPLDNVDEDVRIIVPPPRVQINRNVRPVARQRAEVPIFIDEAAQQQHNQIVGNWAPVPEFMRGQQAPREGAFQAPGQGAVAINAPQQERTPEEREAFNQELARIRAIMNRETARR